MLFDYHLRDEAQRAKVRECESARCGCGVVVGRDRNPDKILIQSVLGRIMGGRIMGCVAID